jgi:LysM repeat protein
MSGTSGLASGTNGVAQLALAAINNGTALAITSPLRVGFLSAVRAVNNGTDTEWTTSGGYTALGTSATGGVSGLTFAATSQDTTGSHQASNVAITVTNAPAQTWAGNIVHDSKVTTNLETWYAPLTGGSKTINAGDTVTISSGSFTSNLG